MSVERFAGTKVNMDKATDEEIMGVLDHSLERLYRAEQEVIKAMGYASIRGLIPTDMHIDEHGLDFKAE